jgi:hypothetical protein
MAIAITNVPSSTSPHSLSLTISKFVIIISFFYSYSSYTNYLFISAFDYTTTNDNQLEYDNKFIFHFYYVRFCTVIPISFTSSHLRQPTHAPWRQTAASMTTPSLPVSATVTALLDRPLTSDHIPTMLSWSCAALHFMTSVLYFLFLNYVYTTTSDNNIGLNDVYRSWAHSKLIFIAHVILHPFY